jgi:hypothetical protein
MWAHRYKGEVIERYGLPYDPFNQTLGTDGVKFSFKDNP